MSGVEVSVGPYPSSKQPSGSSSSISGSYIQTLQCTSTYQISSIAVTASLTNGLTWTVTNDVDHLNSADTSIALIINSDLVTGVVTIFFFN